MSELKPSNILYYGGDGPADLACLQNKLVAHYKAQGYALLRQQSGADKSVYDYLSQKLSARFVSYKNGVHLDRSQYSSTQSTLNRADYPVPLHGELFYTPSPPRMLWFYCEAYGEGVGGETLLTDGVAVYHALPGELVKRFDQQPICYRRDTSAGSIKDDESVLEHTCSAVTSYDGEPAFVNSLLLAYETEVMRRKYPGFMRELGVRWASGRKFERSDIRAIKRVIEPLTVTIAWQPGDILLVDNYRFMHGRNRYIGNEQRRLLTALAEPAF